MPISNPPVAEPIPVVKTETRVNDAASGDVSYTGYGFQPKGIIISGRAAGAEGSIGTTGPALAEQLYYLSGTEIMTAAKLVYVGTGSNHQEAVLKTFDADGFTLTWIKVGTGAQTTVKLHVFAFK